MKGALVESVKRYKGRFRKIGCSRNALKKSKSCFFLLLTVFRGDPLAPIRIAVDVAIIKIAFTTAQRAVEKLEKMSIVKEVTRAKRDRTYCAKVILDILDEPAKV